MLRSRILGNYIGLDLGQRRDYTAVAAINVIETIIGREPVRYAPIVERLFRVTHLTRLDIGTPYTELPGMLRSVIGAASSSGDVTLAVDATGPGMPVVDIIRDAGLNAAVYPAMITGGEGDGSSKSGVYSIPRKTLLTKLRVAMERRDLKVSPRLPLCGELQSEIRTLHHESSAHSRHHDDLVFAVALALWVANIRGAGPRRRK